MTSGHSHDDHDARPDDRLAQAARSAHAASLDRLSPRVRAQLAQRRRAALAEHGPSSAPRRWPMFALGSAAALTLRDAGDTVAPSPGEVAATPGGVAPERTPAEPATAPPATAPAVASTDTVVNTPEQEVDSILIDDELPSELLAAEFSGADEAMGFDALQESPDFYLWLGSDSAQADSAELL